MKILSAITTILTLILLVPIYCCTSTGEVDWGAVSKELHLAGLDSTHAAELVDDAGLKADLVELGALLEVASQVIEGTAPGDTLEAVGSALTFANQVADRLDADTAQFVRISVFAAQSALRRIEAYAQDDG